MAILLPALGRAKEQGKRAVCLSNLKQLMIAWIAYAEDNGDKIVNAQIWKVHSCWPIPFGDTAGGEMYINGCDQVAGLRIYGGQVGWAYWPHRWNKELPPETGSKTPPHQLGGPPPTGGITENTAKEDDWKHGAACGGLWKYIKNFKLYSCPVTEKRVYISYTMSMMMNGHYCNNWCNWGAETTGDPLCGTGSTVTNPPYRSRMAIKNAANRMVFLDTGNVAGGSWDAQIRDGGNCWLAAGMPPLRHGKGTTLSFADGHAEYRKWKNPQTLITQVGAAGVQPCPQDTSSNCNPDLLYMQKIVCGRLHKNFTPPAGCNIE